MTKDDIDRIEELLAKATPGEWRIGRGKSGLSVAALAGKCQQVAASSWHNFSEHYPTEAQTVANFEAIVALHNAAPALIAAARENERLRGALVTAMIPIEAILLSGADAAHCQSVRDALHDAVSTARASLSTAKQGASDAN